jgi:hypothetical protein
MDTNFIKTRIDPVMRDVLAAALNVPTLRERVMPLRWNGEGQGKFAFDAVSENGTVVACLNTGCRRRRRVNTESKKQKEATRGDGAQIKTQIATCSRYSPSASA